MMRFPLVLALCVLFCTACGASQEIPDPQPLPSGASFAGVWYSPQFEHMYLWQSGDQIRGIYAFKTGGRIEGTANGNVLKFEWIDPGDKTSARRGFRGHGYLVLSREGELFVLDGEWGYDDAVQGGGPWKAEYVRTMDSDDPRSLDELN